MNGFNKFIPSVISEYEIYDVPSGDELFKVANAAIDVPEGFVFDPDYLYLWVRIISAGEYYGPNKNGDYFPEQELLHYYDTFKTGHVFKNHENKKVEQAIGEIISVRWNPVMKCVEIFKGIDKKRAPEVARGFLKGYLTDVSMGCKVPFTICSVCGNKARTQKEFCMHVREYRMQYLGNGERVFEINYQPKFHDSSAVLTGAERVAKALVIMDAPPEGVAFHKTAGAKKGVTRFVKLSEEEMKKVASRPDVHPLLLTPMDKSASGILQKIAELEKEVTGKILNVATTPSEQSDTGDQVMNIVRFLMEKRMDDETLNNLADTLQNLSQAEGLPIQKVFSVFLGIAELMGIELFPGELHKLLSRMTDAKLNSDLDLSEGDDDDLYPSEFAGGMNRVLEATKQLPDFDLPDNLVDFYDEGAHRADEFSQNPAGFMSSFQGGDEDSVPRVHVIRIIRHTLTPLMPMRSSQQQFLLPRLAAMFSGFQPMVGGPEARQDFNILANPQTLGDVMATFGFRNYQRMRPHLVRTQMVRLAASLDSELEKVASFGDARIKMSDPEGPKGIGRGKLLMVGAPLIYGISLFQQNRREHGRNLSDAENFIADHPGVISAGVVLGGKPLSRAIARGGLATADKAKEMKGGLSARFARGAEKETKAAENETAAGQSNDEFEFLPRKNHEPEEWNTYYENLLKNSSANEYETIIKLADAFPAGQYNAFDEDTLAKFASDNGLSAQEAAAIKMATLFEVGGMQKEAQDVLDFYQLPGFYKGVLLKTATEVAHEELDKAANDFFNNLLLDGLISSNALPTTLPGRMVDAFVMSKLTNKISKPPAPKTPEVPGALERKDDEA